MISQIEKANVYAEEPHRVQFVQFTATFAGENHTHTVTYDNGKWHCTCHFFETHHWCSHTVALERILDKMVQPVQSEPVN